MLIVCISLLGVAAFLQYHIGTYQNVALNLGRTALLTYYPDQYCRANVQTLHQSLIPVAVAWLYPLYQIAFWIGIGLLLWGFGWLPVLLVLLIFWIVAPILSAVVPATRYHLKALARIVSYLNNNSLKVQQEIAPTGLRVDQVACAGYEALLENFEIGLRAAQLMLQHAKRESSDPR